jgi:hypothetical protein
MQGQPNFQFAFPTANLSRDEVFVFLHGFAADSKVMNFEKY